MNIDIRGNLQNIDFIVIAIYIVVVMAIGFWVSFRKKHSDDLFLAGRQLGWLNIGFSILGTNVSPSMMISSCGVAYATGMVAGNFEWLAWFFLLLLAMVFVPHYINTSICTMPEFMSRRFGQSCHTFLSWYTLFNTLLLHLGCALYAGGVLMGQIMNWPLWLSLLFLIIMATAFTVTGGLAAVAITDTFQCILIIFSSAALTIIGFCKIGSLNTLFDSVPADYWHLFRPSNDEFYPWPAILLGYPVMGVWFWCTDQTIVQRVLGGRDLKQGQLGAVFAAFLKILTPLIFFLPGILCFVLFPGLDNQDKAYMTMVTSLLPHGMIGLIIAALIAALVSAVDAGLNSFSTVLTLDVYCKKIEPGADVKKRIWVGRITTLIAAVIGYAFALSLSCLGKTLFDLFQSIIAFMAPPMATIFLVGVLWKRATKEAAFATLLIGCLCCLGVGVAYSLNWPREKFWPHYLLLSFYLFVGCCALMVLISLFTPAPAASHQLPTLRETYAKLGHTSGAVWAFWIVLALIMAGLYIFFNIIL
jgi:solute:Na+ symporter, SSS family